MTLREEITRQAYRLPPSFAKEGFGRNPYVYIKYKNEHNKKKKGKYHMKLQRSAPEKQGVKSQAVIDFLTKIKEENHELHSFMLLKNGKVISECWWEPYAPQYKHQLFSLSKSFTSSAIGMAVNDGLLTVDTKIVDIFKKEAAELGNNIDEKMKKMTVKHILIMGTGMEYENWEFWNNDANNIKSFLSAHVKNEPGSKFFYTSHATYMQSAIITRLTGLKLVDYLKPRLFDPLDIDPYWEEDNLGISFGGFGLNIKTEDIAKFGQLYLQKGNWNGKQLIPESWIEEATSKHINNADNNANTSIDWSQGYGYQFWMCKPDKIYRGDGAYGQYCVVMPNENAVIAITSNVDMQRILDLIWDILLPALRENNEPNDSRSEYNKLLQAQKNLSHLKNKINWTAPAFPKICGEFATANGDSKIYLDINENDGVVEIELNKNKYVYGFKNGEWSNNFSGQLWEPKYKYFRNKTYCEWKPEENILDLILWFYETPPKNNMKFKFNKSKTKITLEIESYFIGAKTLKTYEYSKI
ncbi:MAG: beta-lactamase family protein [Oscillospiraceae bacterium]|nr:beta-lactamase family protein [Oscillospiraceae bacterium]